MPERKTFKELLAENKQKPPTKGAKILAVVIVLLIIGGIGTCLKSNSDNNESVKKSKKPSEYKIESGFDKGIESIKLQLKAPATAKFPSEYRYTVDTSDATITIFSYVDAQNSFGALLRSKWMCILKYDTLDVNNTDKWNVIQARLISDSD